jgi:hypothetical protein
MKRTWMVSAGIVGVLALRVLATAQDAPKSLEPENANSFSILGGILWPLMRQPLLGGGKATMLGFGGT